MVCKAIMYHVSNHDFSGLPPRAKINDNGLAWIVAKDKLLLWSISLEKVFIIENLKHATTFDSEK